MVISVDVSGKAPGRSRGPSGWSGRLATSQPNIFHMVHIGGPGSETCPIVLWRSRSWQDVCQVCAAISHQVSAVLRKLHSSLVIDTLSRGVDGDGVIVTYVYCDFSTRNVQSTSTVLGSVLRQVVGALAEVPDEVRG